MITQSRRGKDRPRKAALVEPPIVQGEDPNYEEDYVENSTTNGGGGMKNSWDNGDDAVT